MGEPLTPETLSDYQRGYIDGFDAPANVAARAAAPPVETVEDEVRMTHDIYSGVIPRSPDPVAGLRRDDLEWLAWFARKHKGKVADVVQFALEQHPVLRAALETPFSVSSPDPVTGLRAISERDLDYLRWLIETSRDGTTDELLRKFDDFRAALLDSGGLDVDVLVRALDDCSGDHHTRAFAARVAAEYARPSEGAP